MRIVEDTPQRLTLEDRPWLIGTILIVVILAMLGVALALGREDLWVGLGLGLGAAIFGVAFVVFVRRTIVILDRDAAAVVIRTASLLRRTEKRIALADITGAAVESRTSRRTSSQRRSGLPNKAHRPVLQLTAVVEPLNQIYIGGNGAHETVDAINRWLDGHAPVVGQFEAAGGAASGTTVLDQSR